MQSIRRMRLLTIITALGIGLPAAAASAAADQAFATHVAAPPPIVAQVCAACHGRDGNSVDRNVPSLAGQGAAYLQRQLHAFKSQRRIGVMSGVAAGLSDADMRAASTWFAQHTARANPDPWPDSDALRQGATIYRHGIHAKHVPACASCHALDGHGLLPEFPRLAGQHTRYLVAQLRAFRANARLSNPNAMMRRIASRLSDRDIEAVAQYITDLP